MLRIILFTVFLVATEGGSLGSRFPVLAGKIVGGEDATIEEVPYQAALILRERTVCGGSIISANAVVSAAHCVIAEAREWRVRVGTNKNSNLANVDGQQVEVRKIIVHEEYDTWNKDYDVSVFILSNNLNLDGIKIHPIDLPNQNQLVPDGTLAITSGWGTFKEGGNGGTPSILQKVTIPIVNQTVCAESYVPLSYSVTDMMICAGNLEQGGKDACQGDSGGPLVAHNVLVGITSWGLGCARPEYPGVWTRVPALANWIKNQMKTNN